jgi:hypothetical protein
MLIIPVTARIIKQEDHAPGTPGQKQDPTSKIIITKKGWWSGSSHKSTCQQAFKSQCQQKEKKTSPAWWLMPKISTSGEAQIKWIKI